LEFGPGEPLFPKSKAHGLVDSARAGTRPSQQAEGYNEKSKLKTNKFVEMGGKDRPIWLEPQAFSGHSSDSFLRRHDPLA